jgi:hypothetical protein
VGVKDGRFLPPEGLVLDGREHGGRLVCVARDEFHLAATAQDLRKLAALVSAAPPIPA